MDKYSIISELADNKAIEEMILNVKGVMEDDEQDLAQDLYCDLLSKDDELIESLYEKKQLKWFVARMVCNNINSVNSPYYYKYKKDKLSRVELSKALNIPDEINEKPVR